MLRVKGIWQGRILCPDPQPSASSILAFCRWLLLCGLQQDEILDRYDRFVITRSDFVWPCPHPPLSVLDRDAIWVPDGEYYGGISDRHLVASRSDVIACLSVIEDILLHPFQLYEEMKHQSCNNEQFLAYHLKRKGLLHKVRVFPYVMYTARSMSDTSPTWMSGDYEPTVGHFVKYEKEFRAASAHATIIHSRANWQKGAWTQYDPTSVASPLDTTRHYVLSALRRPGQVGRLMRFCKRILHRALHRQTGT
jgi:hypothetical protein